MTRRRVDERNDGRPDAIYNRAQQGAFSRLAIDRIKELKIQQEIDTHFAEIAKSIKRSRKVKTEIDRLNRKTQTIIDSFT